MAACFCTRGMMFAASRCFSCYSTVRTTENVLFETVISLEWFDNWGEFFLAALDVQVILKQKQHELQITQQMSKK